MTVSLSDIARTASLIHVYKCIDKSSVFSDCYISYKADSLYTSVQCVRATLVMLAEVTLSEVTRG